MSASILTAERDSAPSSDNRVDGPIVLAMKPFDGTTSPLAVARWLAHREDRELHIVSVLDNSIDSLTIAAGMPVVPESLDDTAEIAERLRAEVAQASPETRHRVDVLRGHAAHILVDTARERNARLIVIGTGKHERVSRVIYGERAMEIVRLADRPVLVVPRGATSAAPLRAVVAVDFSRASLRAARAIIPMLSPGAELLLLHARPSELRSASVSPTDPNAVPCDAMFASFIRLLDLSPGVKVRTQVVWGATIDVILSFATALDAGLVACGRLRSHTLAERITTGSVSAGLLRQLRCPILIAPESTADARDDARSPLTGIAPWKQDEWRSQLSVFSHRNLGRRVRVGVEGDSNGGRYVVQNYVLRAMALDDRDHVRLTVEDINPHATRLDLSFEDVRTMTRRTNSAGDDTHLVFDYAGGRGTLTLTPAELP